MYRLYYAEKKQRYSVISCYFFRDDDSPYKKIGVCIINGVDYKDGNFDIYITPKDYEKNHTFYNYSDLKYRKMSYNEVLFFSRYLGLTYMPVNMYKELKDYIDILLVNWDVS